MTPCELESRPNIRQCVHLRLCFLSYIFPFFLIPGWLWMDAAPMAPSNPLANWERLGDSFYRKVPIYDAIFDEDLELDNYILAGAPYGGALGMR